MKRFTIILALILSLLIPCTALAAPPASPRDWTKLAPDGELLESSVRASSSILMDARTGQVLFENNADEQRSPASLTKMMTCLVAIEHCELTDQVTVCDLSSLASDASVAHLKEGEVVTMEDLLYGLMLPSGGDAALSIAVHVAGSVDAFSEMMNEKAQELGMTNTHFSNPHGLTGSDHYSTARDMAILTMACMQYPKIRKIVGTYQYTCYPTNKVSDNRVWKNTNKLVNPSDSQTYAYEYAIGVKTGYTDAAGYCLASAAAKDDMELVSVILNGGNNERFVDSITLYEYAFAFYDSLDVQSLLTAQPLTINVSKAAADDEGQGSLELLMVPDGPAWITDDRETIAELRENPDRFTRSVTLNPNLSAPIHKDDEVGSVTFSLDGSEVLTCTLMASRDVAAQPDPTPGPGVTAETTLSPGATAGSELPSPYHRLGWIKYALIALLVLLGVPAALLIAARVKRERQHAHYRYRDRKR